MSWHCHEWSKLHIMVLEHSQHFCYFLHYIDLWCQHMYGIKLIDIMVQSRLTLVISCWEVGHVISCGTAAYEWLEHRWNKSINWIFRNDVMPCTQPKSTSILCGYTISSFQIQINNLLISSRVALLALGQPFDYSPASNTTLYGVGIIIQYQTTLKHRLGTSIFVTYLSHLYLYFSQTAEKYICKIAIYQQAGLKWFLCLKYHTQKATQLFHFLS